MFKKIVNAIQQSSETHNTPFFLYSETQIRNNCQSLKKAFGNRFQDFRPLYAIKANSNPHICKIIQDCGFGFDCSSEAEIFLAEKLGARGMHTGNYISSEELKYAQATGLVLNLDDPQMLDYLDKNNLPNELSLRYNPPLTGGTCELSGKNAKYGITFDQLVPTYKQAIKLGIKKFGIHMMTGSNILAPSYFQKAFQKLFETIGKLKQADINIDFINIGGGFGVPYKPNETELDLDIVAESLLATIRQAEQKHGIPEPTIYAEPGRYLTANAGWLVGQVRLIKNGYKKFAGINVSTNAMPRPAIYDAYHEISVLNNSKETEMISIVGSVCENCDQFGKDRELPILKVGDLVAIHNSGGHGYAMSSNYNGKLKPAEYLLKSDGTIKLIRKAQTISDLYADVPSFASN